ncbi:MAG: hypothetical protein DWP95_05915 [Proteobacteria bacterium]|nr:MAG: hypothetical protein DWP95_05915 [Pseudomonadota bacterium]
MPIENSKIIDLIGRSKNKENEVILTISDHLDWSEPDVHLHFLQDKINMYLAYIESGEILEKYPDAENCILVIKVAAKYPLTEEAKEFYNCVKPIIKEAGFSLKFSLIK